MGVFYVPAAHVRPKVIALLQAYGPTETVAKVAGVSNLTIKKIYSRESDRIDIKTAKKIDEAYKKIPQRVSDLGGENDH